MMDSVSEAPSTLPEAKAEAKAAPRPKKPDGENPPRRPPMPHPKYTGPPIILLS